MTPGQQAYVEFLKSDYWLAITTQRRKIAGSKCELCGSKHMAMHCHHILYRRNWLNTNVMDVRQVCEPCHLYIHKHLPRFGEDEELEARTAWNNLPLTAFAHIRSVRMLDAKRKKQRDKTLRAEQFWLLLDQAQGNLMVEALKAFAASNPDQLEPAREIAKLIRTRAKSAKKKLEQKKQRWDSILPPKRS